MLVITECEGISPEFVVQFCFEVQVCFGDSFKGLRKGDRGWTGRCSRSRADKELIGLLFDSGAGCSSLLFSLNEVCLKVGICW